MDRRTSSARKDDGTERRLAPDRRGRDRSRTVLGARLMYGPELAMSVDLRLRDVSEAGARAVLPPGQPLPPEGVLVVARTGQAHAVRTRWLDGGQAGLSFDSSYDLQSPDLPKALLPLKRIWAELTLR